MYILLNGRDNNFIIVSYTYDALYMQRKIWIVSPVYISPINRKEGCQNFVSPEAYKNGVSDSNKSKQTSLHCI